MDFLDLIFGQSKEYFHNGLKWFVRGGVVYLVEHVEEKFLEDIYSEHSCLVISISKVQEGIWDMVANKGIGLFDVESKICTKTNNNLEVTFRKAAINHLIRFKSVDKLMESPK